MVKFSIYLNRRVFVMEAILVSTHNTKFYDKMINVPEIIPIFVFWSEKNFLGTEKRARHKYNMTDCMVVNPITVNNFASLFCCTPAGLTSDSMAALA